MKLRYLHLFRVFCTVVPGTDTPGMMEVFSLSSELHVTIGDEFSLYHDEHPEDS